jgi:hypothetical protein
MTTYVANRLATKNEIVKILGRGESKIKSNCYTNLLLLQKLLLKLLEEKL